MSEEQEVWKDFEILHLGSHVLYGSDEEYVMLMVGAAELFMKNPTMTSAFHVVSVYKVTRFML